MSFNQKNNFFNRRLFLKLSLGSAASISLLPLRISREPLTETSGPARGLASQSFEEIISGNLPVEGNLPSYLQGTFFSVGPNPVYKIEPYHFFDGDGMVHATSFQNGKANYMNKFVQTEGYLAEKKAGHALYGGRIAGAPFKNAANVSLIWNNQKLFVSSEFFQPYLINSEDLSTLGLASISDGLTNLGPHSKKDPKTGDLFVMSYGYEQKLGYQLHFVRLSTDGVVLKKWSQNLTRAKWSHDFAITENYILFFDLPLEFKQGRLDFQLRPQEKTRIGVLPKDGFIKDISWFEIDFCSPHHTLNAYEQDDQIFFYSVNFKTRDRSTSKLYEWVISLKNNSVSEKPFFEENMNYPALHPSYVGKFSRFGFTAKKGSSQFSGLFKIDFTNKKISEINYGPDRFAIEPFFVPNPAAQESDEGCLLSFVLDEKTQQSELVVYDAHTFSEKPLARVFLPHKIAYGSHGLWLWRSETGPLKLNES